MNRYILVLCVLFLPSFIHAQDVFAPLWFASAPDVAGQIGDLKEVKTLQFVAKGKKLDVPANKLGAEIFTGPVSVAGLSAPGYLVFKAEKLTSVGYSANYTEDFVRRLSKNLKGITIARHVQTSDLGDNAISFFQQASSLPLLADDAEAFCSSEGKSFFGELFDHKDQKDGLISATEYLLAHSQIFVLIDLRTKTAKVIEVQDVSHFNGIYTGEGSAEIYVLDNSLYYVIRLPEPSPTLGIADVKKYSLSDIDNLYKYQEGMNVFLNVPNLGSRFILENASTEDTRNQLNGILSENKSIQDAVRSKENTRTVVR